MKNKTLHIVSFSVPFPANYGGVIDVFYKIKSLFELGVDIKLHCYQYDRKASPELEKYCSEVHYYRRKMNPFLLFSKEPFIVATRYNKILEQRLLKDNHPILLEGVHSCGVLKNNLFKQRTIIIRSHNLEHDYYHQLGLAEAKILKRLYFKSEAKKLLKYERKTFPLVTEIIGISEKDTQYIRSNYGKGIHVSAFHQFKKVSLNQTKGEYAFYHGNLGVAENDQAAQYLVKEVFSQTNYPLIIAGNHPSDGLKKACESSPNVTLKANISSNEIIDLLEQAQINVLPTFQSTGIKLKLLAALFCGKHCLVNLPMVKGTGLKALCTLANTPAEYLKAIDELREKEISDEIITERKNVLKPFMNDQNALKIVGLLTN